jgi:hypothetical protein
MKVNGKNIEDQWVRLTLGIPLHDMHGRQINRRDWATGIELEAVYLGRKWFVIQTYSRWADREGKCAGREFTAYGLRDTRCRDHIERICERLGIHVPEESP